MSNRLDTELRDITESISMLKSSARRGNNSPNIKKVGMSVPDNKPLNEMRLSDGFEDRLMNRVQEALQGIMDQ
jgi:hypothetical protein